MSTSDFLPVTSPVIVPPCMFAPVSMCLPQTVVKPPFVNTITDAQVTSGVGTDEVLLTPTKLKTAITTHAPAGGDTLPAQVTSAEKTARTETALRSFSPKDIADMDISGGGTAVTPTTHFTSYSCCSISINSYPAFIGIIKTSVCR
jgi:hypothetical protein